MAKLNVQICPETGICSLIRDNGEKVDLMPNEVAGLKAVKTDAASLKGAIAEVDPAFAEGLGEEELKQIASRIK